MVLFAVVWKMETLRYSVNIMLSEKKQSITVFVFVVLAYIVYSSDGDGAGGGGGGEELVVMCWHGATASLSFPP